MIDKILAEIKGHSVQEHGVFTALKARKHPPNVLTRYFIQMATFCDAAREQGQMPLLLDQHGFDIGWRTVMDVLGSQRNHEEQLQEMADILIHGGPCDDALTVTFLSDTDEWSQLTDGTIETIHVLCLRSIGRYDDATQSERFNDTLRALGGMLVVEIAMNRQIIPGEVAAFVDSGFYGLALSDVAYLNEHAGEQGAEHNHEQRIITMFRRMELNSNQWQLVHDGCVQMLGALQHFYDDLEKILSND